MRVFLLTSACLSVAVFAANETDSSEENATYTGATIVDACFASDDQGDDIHILSACAAFEASVADDAGGDMEFSSALTIAGTTGLGPYIFTLSPNQVATWTLDINPGPTVGPGTYQAEAAVMMRVYLPNEPQLPFYLEDFWSEETVIVEEPDWEEGEEEEGEPDWDEGEEPV